MVLSFGDLPSPLRAPTDLDLGSARPGAGVSWKCLLAYVEVSRTLRELPT